LERLCGALGITGNDTVVASLAALLCRTRRELYECARHLGLTRPGRLGTEAVASQVFAASNRDAHADHQPAPAMDHVEPEHIPWGYGADRVTAMVVDPEQLYVYWEMTDDAIERARSALGSGGPEAWPCLRVYDVTDRIFDGTNAHSYFDHAVSRDDRQWFFLVGKPASTAVVELGLRSHEGFFVRVARSGRADFPRRDPVSPGGVGWLTLSAARGDVHRSFAEARPSTTAVGGGELTGHLEPVRVWDIRRTHAFRGGEWMHPDGSFRSGWTTIESGDESHVRWEGDVVQTSWEAGPFSYPVALPAYVEERLVGGMSVRSIDGTTHVVFGPWKVVIRGLTARIERRVLGVWEIRRSWVRHAGEAARAITGVTCRLGASEQIGGARERRWLAGSELRLRGASELFMLGASETLYAGASEVRFRGASEQRFRGASEWRQVGGSERHHLGASERGRRPTYPDEHHETAGARGSRR
jgi:hypothetical protein